MYTLFSKILPICEKLLFQIIKKKMNCFSLNVKFMNAENDKCLFICGERCSTSLSSNVYAKLRMYITINVLDKFLVFSFSWIQDVLCFKNALIHIDYCDGYNKFCFLSMNINCIFQRTFQCSWSQTKTTVLCINVNISHCIILIRIIIDFLKTGIQRYSK